MKKQIKIAISSLILGLVVILTYVIIINYSSQNLYNPIYIEKEISRISVTDIINSSIFDQDTNMQKVRKNIDSIYSVADILNIPRDKITGLINSKISTDVITKIVINIINTLITGNKRELFDINDYNQIVDDNIDLITNEINLNLSYEEKIILTKILKEVGDKTIKDIPSTDLVLEKIDNNTLNVIRFITSKQIRYILIIVDISLLIILLLLNINVFKYLFIGLFILLGLLLITSILVYKCANIFNNEWLIIKRFILYFNYNIIISMIYTTIMIIVIFIIRYIIKRKAFN